MEIYGDNGSDQQECDQLALSGNGHQNDHFGWGFLDGKPLDYPLRKSLIEGWDMRKLAYRLYKLCPPPFTNCQDVDEWF